MKKMTTSITQNVKAPLESPGYAWLLATFFLIAIIFLPILVA
jgi:hypothetical protein